LIYSIKSSIFLNVNDTKNQNQNKNRESLIDEKYEKENESLVFDRQTNIKHNINLDMQEINSKNDTKKVSDSKSLQHLFNKSYTYKSSIKTNKEKEKKLQDTEENSKLKVNQVNERLKNSKFAINNYKPDDDKKEKVYSNIDQRECDIKYKNENQNQLDANLIYNNHFENQII